MSHYNSKFYSDLILDGIKANLTSKPTYVYVADGVSDTNVVTDEDTSILNQNETTNQIIFGKKVVESDIYSMVKRNNWIGGTVYSAYDDIDQDLGSKQFFVLNSQRSVYKCINNADGAPSTIEPTSLDPVNVQLADGYIWRFMYRLTIAQLANLSTSTLIPFIEDVNVTSNAVPGTIDYIFVDTFGAGYSAVTSGTVSQVIANTVFRIDNNASAISGIYTGSTFFVQSGPGIGSASVIANYNSNSSGRFVTTTDPLVSVNINSGYYISPSVIITGDGENAKARTVVNEDMSIGSIEVLNSGQNYTRATVEISANTVYGIGATARAVVSPLNGHGSDVRSELFANNLLISVNIAGNEFGTVPTDVTFAKFGLIRSLKQSANTDALYTSNTFNHTVVMETSQVNGNFVRGDILSTTNSTGATAVVLAANSTSVTAVYSSPTAFTDLDNLISESGITASINAITAPNVDVRSSDLMSITNINTITRDSESQETINVILNV